MTEEFDLRKKDKIIIDHIIWTFVDQLSYDQSSFFRCFINLRPLIMRFDTQKIKYNQRQMKSLHLSEEESPLSAEQHSSSQLQSPSYRDQTNRNPLLNSEHTRLKHKAIRKAASKGSKACKDSKSQKGEISSDRSKDDKKMGRPNKDKIDKKHTVLSKQFNDIIYCSSRFLIFFYLMKGKDEPTHALTLTQDQNNWICQANRLMRLDNFPSIQNRTLPFLLHPNSLHFIIDYKVNKNERRYHPQQIKYYLFACLIKKNLLTRTTWMYVSQYWTDIVQLINNWQKDARQRSFGGRQGNYVEYQKEEDQDKGTVESMREEFKNDHSIAAHEIACYLWACCQRFDIQIRSN